MDKRPVILILSVFVCACGARAQCAVQWSAPWTSNGIPFGTANAMTQWDPDGPGPRRPVLVAGGGDIGAYNGQKWRRFGEGLITVGQINAVCSVTTSGVGSPTPGLYAAGSYKRALGEPSDYVSRWDGVGWEKIGQTIGVIHSLKMFDEDGAGLGESNLFVGGSPFEVSGLAWPGLYRWDGTRPTLVGGGLQATPGGKAKVKSMAIFDDDGPGPRAPALYVAGSFQTAGGLFAQNIARWDGTRWEALGFGLQSGVDALAVFDDDGEGPNLPMLYAGGQFSTGVAWSRAQLSRWDGTQWHEVPGYDGGGVESLFVHDDDGDGSNKPALFVSGLFNRVNGILSPGIMRYDGSRWYAVGSGLGGVTFAFAQTMAAFDEDSDPATPPGLYVGGSFFTAGGIWTPGLARWGCAFSTCYADCDKSTATGGAEPVLDIFDFLCFQNLFVNADPYACDCNTATGQAVCDIFDFLCFQNAFVAGCP